MDLLILIPLLYVICTMRISVKGYPDYIDRAQTGAVKGICAVLILLQHMRSYLTPNAFGTHCTLFNTSLNLCGQLMVVMFLFYSGYGVMYALKRNQEAYMSTFLTHRLLKVWLMFAIAVSLYLIIDLVLGNNFPISTIMLSFIGWESIGNSNWFMFDILAMYAFTYFAVKVSREKEQSLRTATIITFCLTLLLIVFLKAAGKGPWWIDTILAYPVGMAFCLLKDRFERVLNSNTKWAALFVAVLGLFSLGYCANRFGWFDSDKLIIRGLGFVSFIGTSSIFAIMVVMLTMKMKIRSKILNWLGENAFSIYILQRLPMILFTHFGMNDNWLKFAVYVILVAIPLAAIYRVHQLHKFTPFPETVTAQHVEIYFILIA